MRRTILIAVSVLALSSCDHHKHEYKHEHDHKQDLQADDENPNDEEETISETDGDTDQAGSVHKVFRMAVLGDSLAVGFLGDTNMGKPISAQNPYFRDLFSGNPRHPSEYDTYYIQNFKNAFSNGDHCVSLACRIEHSTFQVVNLALSGAKAEALNAQLDMVEEDTDHFVVEAGANDFCDLDFDKDTLIAELQGLVEKVSARGKVLLIPVPDIVRLYEEVTTPTDTAFTAADGTAFTCDQIRDGGLLATDPQSGEVDPEKKKLYGFCPRVSSASDREDMKTELTAINAAIKAMASDQVKVAESIATMQFGKEHLGADCFHPSRAGLKMIAEEAYKAIDLDWILGETE